MRTRVLRNVGLTFLSLCLAVVLAELVLRVGGIVPTESLVTVNATQFASVPGVFRPGQDLVDRYKPALPYHLHIDSLGYRGPDFPRGKAPGEVRLFAAGDSFTFGSFVDDSVTLPALLEQELRKGCPSVRVINGGVGGTTIVDQIEMVRRGLSLSPDLVLLIFSENDITDLAQESMWIKLAENRERKSRFPLSVLYPLLRRTSLWNLGLVAKTTFNARRTLPPSPTLRTGALARDSQVGRLRDKYRAEFSELNQLLRRHGIPWVFVFAPSHHTISDSSQGEQLGWASRMAQEVGVRFVDLVPAMRATRLTMEQLYLLPRDGHPSPLGYHAMANGITPELLTTDPLREGCAISKP